MAVVSDPQSILALEALDLWHEGALDVHAVAEALAGELVRNHKADDLADVTNVQITTGQLAEAILGHENAEFLEVVRTLVSATPAGTVQQWLGNDDLVLCAGRVTMDVHAAGEVFQRSFGPRFVTADPGVIGTYVFKRDIERDTALAIRRHAMAELVVGRVPSMSVEVAGYKTKLEAVYAAALTTGAKP